MAIKKILITGSEGYIGTTLVDILLEKDYFVKGIDTLYYKSTRFGKRKKYKLLQKDIRKVSEEDLYDIDAVIHLAALSNDPLGEIKKELTEEINYKATVNLAKKSKKAGVKRFIFSSSCSVYGIAKTGIVSEDSITNPLTSYAKTKIASEKALQKLADDNFAVGILRNSTVYGFSESFRDDLVVNNLVACGLTTGEIKVKSDGTPWRPLIDVRDLGDILAQFLILPAEKFSGEIINIGFNENNFQVRDILNIIPRYINDCKIVFTGEHGRDTRSYKVNFDKATKLLHKPSIEWDLERSIADLTKNLKHYNYTKSHFLKAKFTRITTLNKLLKKRKLNENLFWF